MAKSALARRSFAPRRSNAGALRIAKAKAAARVAAVRAGAAAKARTGTMVSAVGAAAYGALEQRVSLPTLPGVNPALVWGGVLGLVVPSFVKGNTGKMVEQVGSGVLAVAAYKLAQSGGSLAGDDSAYGAGW